MSDVQWLEHLADVVGHDTRERAPARLKSRIYSALISRMAASESLLDLKQTKKAGHQLCVFEHLVTAAPTATGLPAINPCRVCHARMLAERMERAPIFWPGCPYSQFHNG